MPPTSAFAEERFVAAGFGADVCFLGVFWDFLGFGDFFVFSDCGFRAFFSRKNLAVQNGYL